MSQENSFTQIAVLIGRVIFADMFAMALTFKVMGIQATAQYIAAAGIPFSFPLAVLAAIFEFGLVIAFLTGAFFREAALAAVIYVLFLGFTFHGPSHWAKNQDEFGFFMDHFAFAAGLLFAAAYGPGQRFALNRFRLLAPAMT